MHTVNKALLAIFLIVILTAVLFKSITGGKNQVAPSLLPSPTPQPNLEPLSIEAMRQRAYPRSQITIEQTLAPGSNYNQYIASYLSDGLKIDALLTVPTGQKPPGGWPVIVFNHGFIPPDQYRTTERYVAYVDAFARSGYIVFKPDYRGNGFSQGQPEGAYYSPGYTVDDLNALSSIKMYKDSDPSRIGVWGHSMGGNITLRDLVISKDIKAAVIWGGVVGTYDDLMNNWQRKVTYSPPPSELANRNNGRAMLVAKYGTPAQNPTFWHSVDPNYFLDSITAPIQLDVGGADEEVPVDFSIGLRDRLEAANKVVEFYSYPGADHNISQNFNEAMAHSLDFFNKYLKGQ